MCVRQQHKLKVCICTVNVFETPPCWALCVMDGGLYTHRLYTSLFYIGNYQSVSTWHDSDEGAQQHIRHTLMRRRSMLHAWIDMFVCVCVWFCVLSLVAMSMTTTTPMMRQPKHTTQSCVHCECECVLCV